jgi:outer membrane protein OmpA-like peptidoglycan-associated protein
VKNTLIIPMAVAAILAGCASAPERNDQLDQARAQVQSLSQDPLATQAASRELTEARERLQQAESALEERKPAAQVTHFAYLAARNAESGLARVEEARAKERVAQGEAERNRVLLQARTQEAEQAKAQATVAEATAQAQSEAADAAREEAMAARADAEAISQQLAALQAQETKRGMVMTLSDVLFDTGAARLKPGADLALNRLADFMKENDGMRIIIEGHTDSRGDESYNQELSRRRGLAVADALSSRGVAQGRVEVVGRGEAYPVANNDTSAGRQENRRVEIIFSDQGGRFAQGVEEGSLR